MMKSKLKSIGLLFVVTFLFVAGNITNAQMIGPVVSLTGNVFNDITREPVTVFLMIMDEKGKRINATRSNSADNGYYYITGLKPGKKYFIVLKQKNYFKEKFEITVANTDKYEEISRDFLVKPLEQNAQIKIPVPPFELNKSKLRFGAEFLLRDLKNTLDNNPKVKFRIVCYPDNVGDRAENLKLTTERANELQKFFAESGIESSRISVKGSGTVDLKNPPPKRKSAKGKRYIGSSYIVVTEF